MGVIEMAMEIAGLVVTQKISGLSREEFRRVFLAGLCQTLEFGHLVSAGADDLSEEEKEKVIEALSQFIPEGSELNEADLDIIAWGISSRSALQL